MVPRQDSNPRPVNRRSDALPIALPPKSANAWVVQILVQLMNKTRRKYSAGLTFTAYVVADWEAASLVTQWPWDFEYLY